MQIQTASDPDNLSEVEQKHVPVIDIEDTEVIVKVGSIAHPMEEDHFIEWIELYLGSSLISRKNLKPGRKPEAAFHLRGQEGKLYAVAFCNQHGAWKCDAVAMAEV